MSSLKRFKRNPVYLLSTAIQMYRSKGIITLVVEGYNDKNFISQWDCRKVRFEGFEGKPFVLHAYAEYLKNPASRQSGHVAIFLADLDYDVVAGNSVISKDNFIYNSHCKKGGGVHYNDMECYLVNTRALNKILSNLSLDNDPNTTSSIRDKLELASRKIGRYRAADEIIQKKLSLRSSVLNGASLETFFNAEELIFDEECFLKSMPSWSKNNLYIPELIEEADSVDRSFPSKWSLSRGHDVTEMLALHLTYLVKKFEVRQPRVEELLRVGCEQHEYFSSPVGRDLHLLGAVSPF